MMDWKEAKSYADALEDSVAHEATAVRLLADAKVAAERVKAGVLAQARADGVIDGKNAETRKLQIATVTNTSTQYQTALAAIVEGERAADAARANRVGCEARVKLLAGWLYGMGA